MLRQALDDAEAGEKRAAAAARMVLESSELLDHDTTSASSKYGATIALSTDSTSAIGSINPPITQLHPPTVVTTPREVLSEEEEVGDDDDDEVDFSSQNDTDDEDDKSVEDPPPSLLEVIWSQIKTSVRVVANVENLWDSPPPPPPRAPSLRTSNLHNTTTTSSTRSDDGVDPMAPSRRFPHSHPKYVVLFWFVVLALSYAGERSTFKVLVDRTGPFRLFSVQMLTGCHALILGGGLLFAYYSRIRHKQWHNEASSDWPYNNLSTHSTMQLPLGVPYVDCILMAVLDTVTLVTVFLTGEHVPPTLTVILVQFTIPLAAFLSQFIHPDGQWSCCRPERVDAAHQEDEDAENRSPLMESGGAHLFTDHSNAAASPDRRMHSNSTTITSATVAASRDAPLQGWGGLAATHVYGSLILVVAVSLALCPAFYSIGHPEYFYYADQIPMRTAINTLFFVSSCIPAAASQLYKEHIFLQYKQPVNMVYLNLLLSVFQFIFCSIAAPLLYGLQGLGSRGDWTKLYPASGVSENFYDGLKCFFGLLDVAEQQDKYPEEADCRFSLGLVSLHVFSIIAVGVAVDKIVNAGATKVMYRGISAGIIVAVLSMHYYDMQLPDFAYGPAIDALNLACLVLLVLGSEVYHRTGLQEATFETVYPIIEIPAFDD
jgi:CRT-like, chloroquine-resistance transporter-like